MRIDLRRMTPDERARQFKRHGIATTCSLQGVGADGRCVYWPHPGWWQCKYRPLPVGFGRRYCDRNPLHCFQSKRWPGHTWSSPGFEVRCIVA